MRKLRKWLAPGLICMLAIALAACSGNAGVKQEASKPATGTSDVGNSDPAPSKAAEEGNKPVSGNITFAGFAGSAGGFEARANEFKKVNPNINVKIQGIPANSWGELMQTITVNIAGGDIPDIADIASEGQHAFAANGITRPIDDLIERDKDELDATLADIHPNLLEAMKYDGKMYGLPTVWNTMVIYYNKNVLREAGLEPPQEGWTVDDFVAMSQKVIAGNNGTENDKWGYAFFNGYFVTLVPWMLVNDGNVLNDDWTASRLNDPNTIEAMQLLHDFVYKYKISPKLDAGVSDFDLFVQNKLAFMGAGMWQVNGLKNANFNSDDYDVIHFPIMKSKKSIMGIGAAPIFQASKNIDAAWEFAKFLSGKTFQETFVVNDGWSTPATRGAFDLMLNSPGFPKNGAIFYDAAENGVMVPAPQEYGSIESALIREFGAAMANGKTMESAMQAAHEEVTQLLAQRK